MELVLPIALNLGNYSKIDMIGYVFSLFAFIMGNIFIVYAYAVYSASVTFMVRGSGKVPVFWLNPLGLSGLMGIAAGAFGSPFFLECSRLPFPRT